MATNADAALNRSRRARRLHGVYVILNEQPDTLELAKAVLDSSVTVLQYPVNDDWRAAKEFGCDGVHLGPGDSGFADVDEVRFALPEALIGLSCGTIEEITRANAVDVDYLGIGSVFPTSSKIDAGAPIGIDG